MGSGWRASQKASRRADLLRAAASLFAERGFAAVSTVELGDAVGMSGPALYNYVRSKDELLQELLQGASEQLVAGARDILGGDLSAHATLVALIGFHIDFATSEPDIIRIQDRELAQLPVEVNRRVRGLQREYVQIWDGVLARVCPDLTEPERQVRLLGTFGLLNSTPYSATATQADAGRILAAMALRALVEG
ncbi:TetR/AcrR family transcriptional regulator [Microbacterium lacticum]|uniref:TetR/AcrR family transcriptional regulator n=1 Tax=Microbacterium lacticum TaxID=33885 RepID=UPI0018B06319|nr:TetR/AcrR family transcriptional regulator [Microbacterium lacticum]MBF9336956.1 TetR/AcrR family transcriptional regulator [Microbacterium lacticum]